MLNTSSFTNGCGCTGNGNCSDPLKIAYISATSELGGAELSLVTIIKSLDPERFTPVVAMPNGGPLAEKLREAGVEPVFIPMETRRRRHLWAFRQSQKRIYDWLRSVNPDVVHINSFWGAELAVPPAKKAGFPIVYNVRDFHDSLDNARRKAFLMCDAILVNSKCVADNLRNLEPGIRNIEIHYPCVDTEYFDDVPGDNLVRKSLGWENNIVIGAASRLSPEKGQMDFVRAAGMISKQDENARFLVVGGEQFSQEHNFKDSLQNEVIKLGLQEKIHFTGFVKNVPAVYKTMDICVLASHFEPLGRVVLEAMACGVPVVATRSGGPEETVTDGVDGLLVDARNPEQLASACLRLIRCPDLRKSFSEKGLNKVRTEYSLGNAGRIMDFYQRLARNSGNVSS